MNWLPGIYASMDFFAELMKSTNGSMELSGELNMVTLWLVSSVITTSSGFETILSVLYIDSLLNNEKNGIANLYIECC